MCSTLNHGNLDSSSTRLRLLKSKTIRFVIDVFNTKTATISIHHRRDNGSSNSRQTRLAIEVDQLTKPRQVWFDSVRHRRDYVSPNSRQSRLVIVETSSPKSLDKLEAIQQSYPKSNQKQKREKETPIATTIPGVLKHLLTMHTRLSDDDGKCKNEWRPKHKRHPRANVCSHASHTQKQ